MTEREIVDLLTYRTQQGRPFTTAEAARLAGVSGPKALRRLERRGVVRAPTARSRAKGYRVYTAADIDAIRAQIAGMKPAS